PSGLFAPQFLEHAQVAGQGLAKCIAPLDQNLAHGVDSVFACHESFLPCGPIQRTLKAGPPPHEPTIELVVTLPRSRVHRGCFLTNRLPAPRGLDASKLYFVCRL